MEEAEAVGQLASESHSLGSARDNSQAMQSAIQGSLIEREGDQTSWNYLAWDAQAKREVKDTTIAPMTHDRLLRRIKTRQEDAKQGHRSAVSWSAASDEGPSGGDLRDAVGGGHQWRTGTECAHISPGSVQPECLAAVGRSLSPGWITADSLGQPNFGVHTVSSPEDGSDILQQGVPQFVCFHRFTLFNPDNRCYQNAVFLAIAWAHARAGEALPSSYRAIFLQCARCGGMALRQPAVWTQLTSRWSNSRLQHDAAEFLAHLLQQAPVPAFSGSWASYSAGQMRDYHDLGHSPLLLRIGRHRSLQSMIQGWHADPESRNSLLQAPRLLVVQIMRFSFIGGSVRKSQAATVVAFSMSDCCRCACGVAIIQHFVRRFAFGRHSAVWTLPLLPHFGE